MTTRLTNVLVSAAAGLATLAPLSAHEYGTCGGAKIRWAGNSCAFRADSGDFPSGGWRNALNGAISAWNATPANFSFSVSYQSLWNPFTGNLVNEVWKSNDQDLLDGALAVCFSWNACAVRMESDVVFDSSVSWTTSTSKSAIDSYAGSRVSLRAVAIHEFGHALGLKHESDTYNVMGDATTHLHANGSTTRAYAGEDATHGAIVLYGHKSTPREDVGVVHWRRSGSWSGYSQHSRTRVFIGSSMASRYWSAGEPVYRVSRGQTVSLELSYENNGTSSQRPLVYYYVSTNDYISTGDRRIGSRRPTVNRNTVYTTRQNLVIPSDLQVGRVYWLGAKIDVDGRIAEFTESNNATYVAVYIQS